MYEEKARRRANRHLRDFAVGFSLGGPLVTTISGAFGFMSVAFAQASGLSLVAAGFSAAVVSSLVCALCGLGLGRDGRLTWSPLLGASAISFLVGLLVLRRAGLVDIEGYALVAGIVTAGPALLVGFALGSRSTVSVAG